MLNAILLFLFIELSIRVLPLLDSLAELLNHYIAIGVQKCDSQIRHIAIADEKEEMKLQQTSTNAIGFTAEYESELLEEEDDFDEK